MKNKQLELPNLNQLIADANPGRIIQRSRKSHSCASPASIIVAPSVDYVQMEFPGMDSPAAGADRTPDLSGIICEAQMGYESLAMSVH
jgi:hypothetical protein